VPVSEVHVGPLEGQEFPLPHPGVDGEHVEGFEPVALGGLEQRSDLIRRERPHLLRSRSRGLHGLADVARDHVPLHGLIEGFMDVDVSLFTLAGAAPAVSLSW
jgi:hypothetical protein